MQEIYVETGKNSFSLNIWWSLSMLRDTLMGSEQAAYRTLLFASIQHVGANFSTRARKNNQQH